ncbi:sporulation histidine kinase inhibitor Sda [Anaerobacillus isosaccharinicus]|uniref:Sporulation protein n=2 Tax=Anaerobacillus isosaccharinicus TaxID=1532552 RepID=A0A1S2MCY0_9BACI|nr:sporulation histidine kinase inhibitor Sda [Anaerobacillus isosaccharinicus]
MSLSLIFISDEKLKSAQSKAKELKLDVEFLKLLEDEIKRRNLTEFIYKNDTQLKEHDNTDSELLNNCV